MIFEEKEFDSMEETKEAKAARKEISVMEEARAKCKKYSTEAMVGKLILAGLDPEVMSSSGRDDLINYTLTVEGFDVGVILPKKKEKELDPMQMMMKMMMEENKCRDFVEVDRSSDDVVPIKSDSTVVQRPITRKTT